jgi:hypothetical protein
MTKVLTGPELLLVINGKTIGFATNLTYSISQGQKAIMTVDSPFPAEIAQGAGVSMVQGSLSVYRISDEDKKTSLEGIGLIGSRSPDDDRMAANLNETQLGAARYSTVEILHRKSKKRLLRIHYTMFGTQQWSVNSKGVMEGSVTFQGILASHTDDEGTKSFF